MCRIYFSPAGIHFEDLELCRPFNAGEYYQPLLCCIPCTREHEGHEYPAESFVPAPKYGDRSAKHANDLPRRLTSSLPKRSSPLPSVKVIGQSPEDSIAPSMKIGVGPSGGVESDARRDASPIGNGSSPESAKLRPSKYQQKHKHITAESSPINVKSQKPEQESGKKEGGSPALQRSREKKVRFSNIVEERSISSKNSSDESSTKSQLSCTDLPTAEENSSAYQHPYWAAEDRKLRKRLSEQQPDSMSSKISGSDASATSDCSEWLSQCQSSRGYADSAFSSENSIRASWKNDDTESNIDYQEQGPDEGQSYQLSDHPTLNPRHNTFENMSPFDLLEPAYVLLS